MIVKKTSRSIIFGTIVVLVYLLHTWLGERPADYIGPRALLDAAFSMALAGFVFINALALGGKVLNLLAIRGLSKLEQSLFSAALGFGILAYSVFFLGILGWLSNLSIITLVLVTSLFCFSDWEEIFFSFSEFYRYLLETWRKSRLVGKFVGALIIGLLLVTCLNALTPPWAYDTLMYHLEVPKTFIEKSSIRVIPDYWETAFPLNTQMLYIICLGFGSESAASIIHLVFGILVALGCFGLAYRLLASEIQAWVSVGFLIGVPVISFLSMLAYSDFAWGLYAILAVYALNVWNQKEDRTFLILAGLMAGLSAGCKLTGLEWTPILALLALIFNLRRYTVGQHVWNLLLFGVTATLVGSPWYIRNWIQTGNPVFPLFFPGTLWSPERIGFLNLYMESYGVGHSPLDLLHFPINIYTQSEYFNGFSIETPGLLFPLAVLYPLFDRRKSLHLITASIILYGLIWFYGLQASRHLTTVYPFVCILTTITVFGFLEKLPPKMSQIVLPSLLSGLILTSLIYQGVFALEHRSMKVLTGQISKADFLSYAVYDYNAVQYMTIYLPPESRVLFLWNGQGYYCDHRCIPDPDQSRWLQIVDPHYDIHKTLYNMKPYAPTHILFSHGDANWFTEYHDPTGLIGQSVDFFFTEFQPACLTPIFEDETSTIYKITCSLSQ